MNYMEQVAKMLGVELEEEFRIKYSRYKYKITKKGLVFFDDCQNRWKENSNGIMRLILGEYVIDENILDDKEKKYLGAVIKPFRKHHISIRKNINEEKNLEFITVDIDDYEDDIIFPYFDKGTMYKGMELNKKYSLEDLGL